MRLYTDRDEERSLRETLLLTADEYRNLRESIGIPITNFYIISNNVSILIFALISVIIYIM